MKTLLTTVMLAMAIRHTQAAFISNVMTTNDTPTALNLVTNISKLTTNGLITAGALTVSNYRSYADQNGSASLAQENAIIIAGQYTDDSFAFNQYGWIPLSAFPTNHITKLDTNVVSTITFGTGISGSSSVDSTGIHFTIQATGTNNTSITNLNPTVLANAGGLTTNNYGTYADLAGAANAATNTTAIVRSDNPKVVLALTNASAFDAAGAATGVTNNGVLRFTNNPVVGSLVLGTNMVLNAVSTNSRGEITYSISSSAGGVTGIFQPAATNLYQWASINTNQLVLSTNIVGQMIGGTSIGLTAVTNVGGLVSVTISYTGTQIPQAGSQNLTNWSTIPTNSVIIGNTNLVTKITPGTGITITATTNQFGINYTVTQTTSPAIVRAGSFTAVSSGSGSVVFSSTMGSTPVVTLGPTDWGNNASGRSFVIITAVSATGFSWSDANDTSGINKSIYYIATLPQ